MEDKITTTMYEKEEKTFPVWLYVTQGRRACQSLGACQVWCEKFLDIIRKKNGNYYNNKGSKKISSTRVSNN